MPNQPFHPDPNHPNTGRVRPLLQGESPRPSVGDRFGRLTVVSRAENKGKYKCWNVSCDCGNTKTVYDGSIRSGRTTSCGCLAAEVHRARLTTHGQATGKQTKEYMAWRDMLQRCNNPNNPAYKNYGERGIKVAVEWLDFAVFLTDMGLAPRGLTLERLNNELGYSKDNCAWATYKSQLNNRRNNVILEFNGESLTVAQWAEKLGMKYETLKGRLRRGVPLASALTTEASRNPWKWRKPNVT